MPRSPCRKMTPPCVTACANCSPQRTISASSVRKNSIPLLPSIKPTEYPPYACDQIGRQQPAFTLTFGAEIRRSSMNIHTRPRRIDGTQALCSQRADDTGEHVPHATTGHTRIARTAQMQAVTVKTQTAGSFQHHCSAQSLLQLTHRSKAVALNTRRLLPQQTRSFTRMRCQNPVMPTGEQMLTLLQQI